MATKSNRAKVGKPIKITYGVRQRKLISDQVNKENKTPHDFILSAGLEAADEILNAPKQNDKSIVRKHNGRLN